MLTPETVAAIDKSNLEVYAGTLTGTEIAQLVDWLARPEDSVRYPSLLLLQYRSRLSGDVYPYWERFRSKLESDNSFQRNIGLILLAENARWDAEGKMARDLDGYLALLDDPKPITVRYCVQSLGKIVPYKPELCAGIAARLISCDLMAVRETMRKPVLLDILNVLLIIRGERGSDEIDKFILDALSGELLDKRSKKEIAAAMRRERS